jgi:outer membrane protein OmpA-like peptidoglycan-associated protein
LLRTVLPPFLPLPAWARRALAPCLALALAALLGACATPGPAPAPAPAAPPSVGVSPSAPTAPSPGADGKTPIKPAPAAPPPTALATEQQFFESRFSGTPVAITAQAPSTLLIEVPLNFSFDPAKADVKPPLAKLLEYVAESLKRQIGARIVVLAPADAGGPPALAAARAQRVRDSLVAKQISAPRIAIADAPGRAGSAVQLRLSLPSPAIARLKDSGLVVPSTGVKPVSSKPPS